MSPGREGGAASVQFEKRWVNGRTLSGGRHQVKGSLKDPVRIPWGSRKDLKGEKEWWPIQLPHMDDVTAPVYKKVAKPYENHPATPPSAGVLFVNWPQVNSGVRGRGRGWRPYYISVAAPFIQFCNIHDVLAVRLINANSRVIASEYHWLTRRFVCLSVCLFVTAAVIALVETDNCASLELNCWRHNRCWPWDHGESLICIRFQRVSCLICISCNSVHLHN